MAKKIDPIEQMRRHLAANPDDTVGHLALADMAEEHDMPELAASARYMGQHDVYPEESRIVKLEGGVPGVGFSSIPHMVENRAGSWIPDAIFRKLPIGEYGNTERTGRVSLSGSSVHFPSVRHAQDAFHAAHAAAAAAGEI